MPETKTKSDAKALVIVESPAKARTIGKFLGSGFTVEASIGHIRDLPSGKKEMPDALKKEHWARLGVNVDDQFQPVYVVPPEKKAQVDKLKKLLRNATDLYLATDEDREGEAISWHLREVLKPKVPVRRLVFHEITREAIEHAVENPRQIDDGLVRAQETRRILDRLYGFEMSEFLWKKSLGRSAGRVQSVAVRLIVERERQRMAFVSAVYWDLLGTFLTERGESLEAELVSVDGRLIPSGKDFDSATGQLKSGEFALLDQAQCEQLRARLRQATFRVTRLEVKPYTRQPAAPFTTSTLQQEANRKLGFTARRTMSTAQSLYENGHITYMRTDSTNLAAEAIEAARDLVRSEYGTEYLPATPRSYTSKVKNAQEAHEAIRPAGHPFQLPQTLQRHLSGDEFKLFELIWKRTIASQMTDSRGRMMTVAIEGGGAVFQITGKTIDFAGFLRAYVEGSDDPEAELADQEKILPPVVEGSSLRCRELESKEHRTQPPARFSEAALTRELERRGIGRPSTYASIIETVQARKYVTKKGNALIPTWSAFAMVRMMEEHFLELVDYEFTAQMEDLLDAISRGEAEYLAYLNEFYFGTKKKGLKHKLAAKIKEVDARTICTFPLGQPTSGEHREPIAVRVGRYGPFLEQGDRKASIPDDLPPDELTLAVALDMLGQAKSSEEPLGVDPATGRPVYIKVGRFGAYVQLGAAADEEKPRSSSIPKNMPVDQVTLELALKLLSLPRTLGPHPTDQQPVVAHQGRFGPYIKCGSETRSLPADLSPLDVTLEQAIALLAQPKTRGRGRSAPREPLKIFDQPSPVTGEPIKLLDGRFGPYLNDGATNASLPKDLAPADLTLERALEILADRAAKTGGRRRKKAPRKPTARTRPAKKSTKKPAK
jgi:DNA topoisomerase-1